MHVNGITGQGSFEFSTLWTDGDEVETVEGKKLRFSMPAALCSYCLGETRIGSEFQMGNVRKMDLGDTSRQTSDPMTSPKESK
jgi:hypothetical protein